jgi:sialate O-acetylesterase
VGAAAACSRQRRPGRWQSPGPKTPRMTTKLRLLTAACLMSMVVSVTGVLSFASIFGDDMVLQRTQKAAVYGAGAPPGSTVKVTVGGGRFMDGSTAETASSTTETTADVDGHWKALLAGHAAGTGFTVTASSGTETAKLQRVAYGDVYFCSGQSNMELGLHFTFSVNKSMAAIVNDGKYANLRLLHFDHNPLPTPQWVPNGSIVNPSATTNSSWLTPSDAITSVAKGCRGPNCQNAFTAFSATCWYFGESLTDRMTGDLLTSSSAAATPTPLGLIESAFGGTCIESWFDPEIQLASCSNITCTSNQSLHFTAQTRAACEAVPNNGRSAGFNGELFHGMVQPFVNMTLKGFLWYQGVSATATPPPGQNPSALH